MKIAVLSDTRLPTRRDYAGHGLGAMVLAAAEGLAARGHTVTLFAGAGSRFESGALVMAEREEDFKPEGFDAILDSTHQHGLQRILQTTAIVNWSHDREAKPGSQAVFPTEAHKAFHKQPGGEGKPGRVVHNGVEISDLPDAEPPRDYFLYLASFYPNKGPVMAANAARLAGVRLVMAGPTPPGIPVMESVAYVGPVWGEDKTRLLAGARALLFPASIEAGSITPLEAQAVGTPVIATLYGGAGENIATHHVLGLCPSLAADTLEMADFIRRVRDLAPDEYQRLRARVRGWVQEFRSVGRLIDGLEAALKDAAGGLVW